MISIYMIIREWKQWKPVKPWAKIILYKRNIIFAVYILGFGFAIVKKDIEKILLMLMLHQIACSKMNHD